jgi:hypothetical protein
MPHESTYVATPKDWLDLIATILLNHVGKELREIQELRNSFVPSVTAAHVGYEQTRETAEAALSRALEVDAFPVAFDVRWKGPIERKRTAQSIWRYCPIS